MRLESQKYLFDIFEVLNFIADLAPLCAVVESLLEEDETP